MRALSTLRTGLRLPVSNIPATGPCRIPARSLSRLYRPSLRPAPASSPALLPRRYFHPTRRRDDVFFFSLPALKSGLLSVTRFSLLFLPFVFRYKLWKKYRRMSYLLIQIPVSSQGTMGELMLDICHLHSLCAGLGPISVRPLAAASNVRGGRDGMVTAEVSPIPSTQPKIGSHGRHEDVLKNDGALLLPPDHPESKRVARVTSRLVTALEEHQNHVVCDASWPPRFTELSRVMSEKEASQGRRFEEQYKPSGVAKSGFMPYRPASSNPLKRLEAVDWNLYVIDMPQLNAFALPSKDIFVYTGLLKTLPDDDAMLAAVLAHEIAHVTERHSVENLGFLNVAAVAFDVLRGISFALTISFPFITDSAGVFINWLNDVVAERAYSRKLEMEADAVGLDLMAMAGYDPRAALDLWELMSCVEQDAVASGQSVNFENRFALLRTHPTSEDRLSALQKDLDGAMRLWRQSTPKKKGQVAQELAKKRGPEGEVEQGAEGGVKREAEGEEAPVPAIATES